MSSVSVIIPTYNGGEQLLDAVQSALQQTHAPAEIIVVDDGSQEDILGILSPVSRRIKYIRQDNGGPSAARNRGIKAARGEYIAFLDDDDLWHPRKIEAQMRCMNENPDCGLVYSFPFLIDDRGAFISRVREENGPSGYVYHEFLRGNRIYTPSVTLQRASVFEKVGGFDENTSQWEDYDLWVRIANQYKVGFCSDAIIYYRWGESGISRNNYKHLKGYLYVMGKIIDQCIDSGNVYDKNTIDAVHENLCSYYRGFAYKIYYENDDVTVARSLMRAAVRKGRWCGKDLLFLLLFSLPGTLFEHSRNLKRALWGPR